MALKRQTAALEGLFQVRTIHVSLGKELMMLLMQYYTSYFISPEAHANTPQEEAVIKVNSFKTHKTCSQQALVKKSAIWRFSAMIATKTQFQFKFM